MKKVVLLLLVFAGIAAMSFAEDVKTVKFKKLDKFKLSEKQSKAMKKTNLNIYQIKGGYAYPGKGTTFYAATTSKGGKLILVLDSNPKITTDFIEVSMNELPFEVTGIGVLMEYCSCGSNLIATEGDACHQFQVNANTIGCGGGCTGENLGKSCSFTVFDTETGVITTYI